MNANRIWGLVTALVSVGVLALGWVLGVSPLLTQASAAEAELSGVQATNQAQQAMLDEMREKFENLDQYRDELTELQSTIPGAPNIEDFYGILDDAARASETHILAITTPEPAVYGQNADGSPIVLEDGATPLAAPPTGRLAEALWVMPVTIELENKPDQAMNYVRELQKLTRYVFVAQITMDGGRRGDPKATITAYAFVIEDPTGNSVTVVPEPAEPDPAETPDPTGTPVPTESPTPEG